MCVKYESCRTYLFYMVTLQRLPIFHYFVCNSMGSSPTGSSPTGSPVDSSHILSHKSHNTYLIDLEVFVFERGRNYLQYDTKLSTIGNKLLG